MLQTAIVSSISPTRRFAFPALLSRSQRVCEREIATRSFPSREIACSFFRFCCFVSFNFHGFFLRRRRLCRLYDTRPLTTPVTHFHFIPFSVFTMIPTASLVSALLLLASGTTASSSNVHRAEIGQMGSLRARSFGAIPAAGAQQLDLRSESSRRSLGARRAVSSRTSLRFLLQHSHSNPPSLFSTSRSFSLYATEC